MSQSDNSEASIEKLRKSAIKGNINACYQLGHLLLRKSKYLSEPNLAAGEERWNSEAYKKYEENKEALKMEALDFFLKAATKGHAESQIWLSLYHEKKYNHEESLKWINLAVQQGNLEACYILGRWLLDGDNHIERNWPQAFNLFRYASERNHSDSRYFMGLMYEEGKGVVQSYVKAYMWYCLAAAGGDEEAIKERRVLEKKMTMAKVMDAQKLAEEWQPLEED